jgi:hypothetical protein
MTIERARDTLGWAPTHTLPEILRGFVASLHRGAGGTGPLLYPRRRQHS